MSELSRSALVDRFAARLRYRFRDPDLLTTALTHRSFSHESSLPDVADNERLEYLGDAVLDLLVARATYLKRPDLAEGELSPIRARVVNETTLATLARKLELGPLLRLGRGEVLNGGTEKDSILADAFEAVVAAVYLDSDSFSVVYDRYLPLLADAIDEALTNPVPAEAKGELQRQVRALGHGNPVYRVIAEEGPPHAPEFTVEVTVPGLDLKGSGKGGSKRRAELEAAQTFLPLLEPSER